MVKVKENHGWIKAILSRKIVIAGLMVILVFGICVATYGGAVMYIKNYGITLKPSRAIEPLDVKIFLQNDDQWGEDYMGESKFKMRGYGCLVSVLASASKYHGIQTDPGKLNKIFTQKGVYTNSGEVIWYKIKDALGTIDYKYGRIFDRGRIENDLKKGLLPIVMVKYHGTGIHHWVLIVGANDDFLIVDPLSKEIIPLSTHGRVYAYRVLTPQEDD